MMLIDCYLQLGLQWQYNAGMHGSEIQNVLAMYVHGSRKICSEIYRVAQRELT